jgi:hypothetical protein
MAGGEPFAPRLSHPSVSPLPSPHTRTHHTGLTLTALSISHSPLPSIVNHLAVSTAPPPPLTRAHASRSSPALMGCCTADGLAWSLSCVVCVSCVSCVVCVCVCVSYVCVVCVCVCVSCVCRVCVACVCGVCERRPGLPIERHSLAQLGHGTYCKNARDNGDWEVVSLLSVAWSMGCVEWGRSVVGSGRVCVMAGSGFSWWRRRRRVLGC